MRRTNDEHSSQPSLLPALVVVLLGAQRDRWSAVGLRAREAATHVDVLGQARPVVPQVVGDLAG